jgi:hypothetical protein
MGEVYSNDRFEPNAKAKFRNIDHKKFKGLRGPAQRRRGALSYKNKPQIQRIQVFPAKSTGTQKRERRELQDRSARN